MMMMISCNLILDDHDATAPTTTTVFGEEYKL
jgi:hypothetical protein